MYDLIDQPVARLCNGGRFLLWAMRGWSRARAQGTCPPVALVRGFAGVGALSALHEFHMAMALLDRDAQAPFAFASMDSERIAEDEAVLAALWRDAAFGRTGQLEATLALLVGANNATPLAPVMVAATASLAAAGLALSPEAYEPQKEPK